MMGKILTKMRHYAKAEDHYTKTLNILHLMTNSSRQAKVLEVISDFYLTQKKRLEAEKFFINSLTKWTKLRNKSATKDLRFPILMLRSQLGMCYAQMDGRYQYQAEDLLCGVLNNLQILSNVDEKSIFTLNTTFWLSLLYKKNGKLSKAKELSTKWLGFYSQCQQTLSVCEKEIKDIQLVKPGPIISQDT